MIDPFPVQIKDSLEVEVIPSSRDSYNEDWQKELWERSMELVGITQKDISLSLDHLVGQ